MNNSQSFDWEVPNLHCLTPVKENKQKAHVHPDTALSLVYVLKVLFLLSVTDNLQWCVCSISKTAIISLWYAKTQGVMISYLTLVANIIILRTVITNSIVSS